MKKIYSAVVAIVAAGSLVATAAEQHQSSATQPLGQQEHQRTGGVMLQRGFIKQGDKIFRVDQVTKATELEGIKVDEQGHIMKNGKRIELKDGQLVTPEGQVENFEHKGQ